jgi:PAS domain-containing protein
MEMLLLCLEMLAVANSAIVLIVAFLHWREIRMRFFFGIAFGVFLFCCVYFFEITSPNLDSIVIAVKMNFTCALFIAMFCLLFSFDYVERKIPSPIPLFLALWTLAWVFLIWVYPHNHLLFAAIGYAEGGLPHANITGGLLYYFYVISLLLMFFISAVVLLRSYFVMKRRPFFRSAVVFSLMLPLAAQSLDLFDIIPLKWNPVPLVSSFSLMLICLYLVRYLTPEWESLGRSAAVQAMRDAFLLVDGDNFLIDMNEQAISYFPPLATAKIGSSVMDVKGFPCEILDGEVTSLDYSLPPYGDTRHYSISHSQIVKGRGLIGHCIVAFDTTESVRATDLQQQRELSSNMTVLLDSAPYIGIIFSETYSIIDCNPAALRVFRFHSKQEFINGFMALLQDSERKGSSNDPEALPLGRRLRTAFETGRATFRMDLVLRGESLLFNVTMKAIRYGSSRVVVTYLIPRTESENRNQLMLDAAPFACDFMDKELSIIDCNLIAVHTKGFKSKEDYLSNHWRAVPQKQSDGTNSRELLKKMIGEALEKGQVIFDFTFCSVTEPSKALPSKVILVHLRQGDEDVFIRYTRDITRESPAPVALQ